MKACPMYNGENLNFTGNTNPYGLIQMGGKRRVRKSRRTRGRKTRGRGSRGRKTRKYVR